MTSADRLVVEHLAADALDTSDAATVWREFATAALDRLREQHVEMTRMREQHYRLIADYRALREQTRRRTAA